MLQGFLQIETKAKQSCESTENEHLRRKDKISTDAEPRDPARVAHQLCSTLIQKSKGKESEGKYTRKKEANSDHLKEGSKNEEFLYVNEVNLLSTQNRWL